MGELPTFFCDFCEKKWMLGSLAFSVTTSEGDESDICEKCSREMVEEKNPSGKAATADGKCQRCGRNWHHGGKCNYGENVDGKPIGSNGSYSSTGKTAEKGKCSYCGKGLSNPNASHHKRCRLASEEKSEDKPETKEEEGSESFSYTSRVKETRGLFRKRLLTIRDKCVIEDCKEVLEFSYLTEPIRSKRGVAPKINGTDEGYEYSRQYFDCGGEDCPVVYPEDGDGNQSGVSCDNEGHVCKSCLRVYEKDEDRGGLHVGQWGDREELIRSYKDWLQEPTAERREGFKRLAIGGRKKWNYREEQIAWTERILHEFVHPDGGRSCARLSHENIAKRWKPWGMENQNGWPHVEEGACTISSVTESVTIAIPPEIGEKLGEGPVCHSCLHPA